MRGVQDIGLKEKAIALRRRGESYKSIRTRLDVPLSTLSGWLRDVPLSITQRAKLDNEWRRGLVKARKKAVAWHNEQKGVRLAEANRQATEIFQKIPSGDQTTLEIALAFLYLGEGFKRDRAGLGLGNSDPKVLRFYVQALKKLYGIQPESLRAELHLRDDQDEEALKIFWSKELHLPLSCFKYAVKDRRTAGRPTYARYKGVCSLTGGGVEIQRRLMYLADVFCARS